jgi:KUP system potassium uptake protein
MFLELTNDQSVPVTATNLVYIIKANRHDEVESKVIYSIFKKQPKRAKTYWFLHVDIKSNPFTFEYYVKQIIPGVLIRIDFHLGFKVEPKINLYFKEVLEDLTNSGEIVLESSFRSIRDHSLPADFQYILIDRVMLRDYKLTNSENLILLLHGFSRLFSTSDVNALNLDRTNTLEEKVPIVIKQNSYERIRRSVDNFR